MATILFTWELGSGLGHLIPIRPLATEFARRGHRVFVALADLSAAQRLFAGTKVMLLQAPFKHNPGSFPLINPCHTYAQLLHNIGFGDGAELAGMANAWQSLYSVVRPKLLICDHSPTALLAARGFPMRRFAMGVGFFCPIDESPLPNLRPNEPCDECGLRDDETRILQTMNALLISQQQRPLDRITQIYSEATGTILATFPELDHFPQRRLATYWGVWTPGVGDSPVWPPGDGPKIFAYLRSFRGAPAIFAELKRLGCPALVRVERSTPMKHVQLEAPHLRLVSSTFDIAAVAASCDLAILNGNHGTTAAMLLAGKPILHIPLTLEHFLLARRVAAFGASAVVHSTEEEGAALALRKFIAEPQYGVAARQFRAKYLNYDPQGTIQELVDMLEHGMGNETKL